MAFTEDEHPVGAFPPYGAYPAFRDCVGGRLRRGPDHLDPRTVNSAAKTAVELRVAIATDRRSVRLGR
jgi:hypothetical protein